MFGVCSTRRAPCVRGVCGARSYRKNDRCGKRAYDWFENETCAAADAARWRRRAGHFLLPSLASCSRRRRRPNGRRRPAKNAEEGAAAAGGYYYNNNIVVVNAGWRTKGTRDRSHVHTPGNHIISYRGRESRSGFRYRSTLTVCVVSVYMCMRCGTAYEISSTRGGSVKGQWRIHFHLCTYTSTCIVVYI